ncbi:hypothetical protein Ais01nite_74400 [Asanoa ishikariensis]|uniref:ATP-binding cassette, subfamily B n=2 Tax=Asanoa ishikariensis TaxID=137265 RepID=A0A1H3US89_9ACTN|nr:ATP-binding cassette domain-containing protein [Asanoa ishikariensis]GIF69405.1 hypothetical protein Ais01nite_74400 [Asanoa ishikariensis]SDZ65217.1 ATP-binding cassette, subfamily B [Asanoa ishikariensis]
MSTEVQSVGDATLLSGGQWQRVAIARASLWTDSDLLILDEPSAALDPETEAAIRERLADIRHERTSILKIWISAS